MITHTMEQYSDEWWAVRLGIPTASRFKDIYTSTGKSSTSAQAYMYSLIAERMAGKYLESYTNQWMERGIELEAEARSYYELLHDCEVQKVGFVTNDEGTAGCSPDGMRLEIKCPAPHTHIKYLLGKKCPSEYAPQVQGSMWICEQDHWDFMSYHPDLPPLIVRVNRDETYIAGLSSEITEFLEKMERHREQLESAA